MPKALEAQRDFSAGEIDVSAKRSDQSPEIAPLLKAGLRQASNMRIRNSKALRNRPGRSALFLQSGRVEKILMSPGNYFYLVFGNASLQVYNAAGTRVASANTKADGVTPLPWTTATIKNIVWANIGLSIYITYADGAPANVPQILTWDGVSQTSAWTQATFAEAIVGGGKKRTPFYRISPQGITMLPSATTGAITLSFSAALLAAGMIGTRMRFCGRQILITGFTNSLSGSAVVIEPLPPGQQLTVSTSVGVFNVGDEVRGVSSGAIGVVAVNTLSTGGQQTLTFPLASPMQTSQLGDQFTGGTSGAVGHVINKTPGAPGVGNIFTVSLNTGTLFVGAEVVTNNTNGATGTISSIGGGGTTAVLIVQLLQSSGNVATFSATDTVVGPSGSAVLSASVVKVPQAVTVWDDEVMNGFRGWPSSCFADQGRLGLCNFPPLPNAIAWSAINAPTDLYVGAQPSEGMFELAPDKVQVYFVLAGPESSEFVFADRKVYYIPISVTNPLEPGRVAFNILSSSGALPVQPRVVDEDVIYVDGANTIMSIVAPGMYYRPYGTRNLTPLSTHLIKSPIALAIPTQQGTFAEQYIYALNADGTIAVGKYETENGQIKGVVGWTPWSGAGVVSWVAAVDAAVIFTTQYLGASVVEALDDTVYLDAAMFVNAAPAALAPPGGGLTGPLWWIAGRTADLMDQATRMMGTYQIDASGHIVPQNNGGENLAAASLVAGQFFELIVEPFIPAAPPGQDAHQRMTKRRISRFEAYVSRSTGFLFAKIASRIGPLLPPVGTVFNLRRVMTWNQDDDPTQAPYLRESAYRTRPSGRDFDPRVAIIKDTPGPIEILELTVEAST